MNFPYSAEGKYYCLYCSNLTIKVEEKPECSIYGCQEHEPIIVIYNIDNKLPSIQSYNNGNSVFTIYIYWVSDKKEYKLMYAPKINPQRRNLATVFINNPVTASFNKALAFWEKVMDVPVEWLFAPIEEVIARIKRILFFL